MTPSIRISSTPTEEGCVSFSTNSCFYSCLLSSRVFVCLFTDRLDKFMDLDRDGSWFR